jgi:hypothetical protein
LAAKVGGALKLLVQLGDVEVVHIWDTDPHSTLSVPMEFQGGCIRSRSVMSSEPFGMACSLAALYPENIFFFIVIVTSQPLEFLERSRSRDRYREKKQAVFTG